jgi:two-component system sensor histidine kinase QseC
VSLPRSLHGRLLVLVSGVVLAVWLIAGVLSWVDARNEIDRLLDSHLAQAAALLVMRDTQTIDSDEALDAPVLHPYAPRVVFQVFHEGRLGLHSANAPNQPMLPLGQRRASSFQTVEIDGSAWRIFAAPGLRQDIEVFVGEQIDSRTSILLAIMRSAFWPLAGALPLLAVGTWWAVRRGVAPLRELERTLTRRDPHALHHVVMTRAPQEMQPMLDALNRLFDRIRTALEAERRFTADAAHELRTPIAAIKAQAQVAIAETHAARRQHALAGVLDGCNRAGHLVDQLLLLARLEAQTPARHGDVDLAQVARRALAGLAPHAIGRAQHLELDAEEHCTISGNEALLESLIRNLVDNAIRYSPAQSRIVVALSHREARVLLVVQDSGPGLSQSDIGRLGERFFRAGAAGQPGSGLGWSIIRRIAAVHGADVAASPSSMLGGLSVQVSFPASSVDANQPAPR